MSLKSFHIVFISLSMLLAFWFGFWNINQAEKTYLVWGIFSFLAGGFLLAYGVYFYKKMFLFILPFISLFYVADVFACATCFGDPNSLQTQGMNMAILFLLGVTALILGSFAFFFIYLWKMGKMSKKEFS